MKCSKCGFVLPNDSEFCQYCGVKLNQEVTSADLIEDAVATPVPETLIEQPEPLAVSADTIAEPVVVEAVHEPIDALEELSTTVVDVPLSSDSDAHKQTEPSIVSAPAVVPKENPDAASPPKKAKYCKRCGGLIDTQTKKCSKCGKQYFRVKKSFLVFVLIIVLFGSIGLNIGQHLHSKSIISDLENTVLSQKLTLSSKQAALARYENDFNLLAQGNIGYASNNFKADQSIIVLHKNETKKFKLTANWSGNISIENSHRTVAGVSFDNDSWHSSTSMTVEPRTPGTTVVTFGNDVDSRTFSILIIVTEAPPKMSLSEYLESLD